MRFELPLLLVAAIAGGAAMPAWSAEIDFDKQIAPILQTHCLKCHGPAKQQGGLRFDSSGGMLAEGDSGEVAVAAGDAAASELIRRVTSDDPFMRMPPEGDPLSAADVELLRRWIDAGAKRAEQPTPTAEQPIPIAEPGELMVTDEDRRHWSFRPLRQPSVPAIASPARARTPIDAFILAALESQGLGLADQASPRTLIRRIKMDLVGLPPTPAEIADFQRAAMRDPRATTMLIEGYLGSLHYGERWGRHWLDVARYADSHGQEGDQDRPYAFQYRDFVIQAWNDDMPFDQFARWQIAGNEIAPDDPLAVAATGFLAAGPSTELKKEPMEKEQALGRFIERMRNRYNELDDIMSTLGTGMLGLTVGCARCHDHKFDAIPTRDYYRMLSAFEAGERGNVVLTSRSEIKALPEVEPSEPPPPQAFVYFDQSDQPQPTWLFRRGDFQDRSEQVELGFLTVLTTAKSADQYWATARSRYPAAATTYQRAALADWLTDVDHGAGALLARVIVNRVWQHHFGQGLVRTPDDFGVQGERPTHPELLEWLAFDLVANGWRIKRLHRQIMTSAVYLQDVTYDARSAGIDPENRLLWRRQPLRLEAEAIRDAMLMAAGTLNCQPFGPGFKPPIPKDVMVARNLQSPYQAEPADSPNVLRRSVYMFHKRVIPQPLMELFDRPAASQSCGRRQETLVAPQALALLNDPFVRQQAEAFARRLIDEGDATASRVELAFETSLGRLPRDGELAAACDFIAGRQAERHQREGATEPGQAYQAALADYCQVLFGLNEFLYVD